ncbi:MAG: serine/threonine protein kinase [Planctomycetota bacterium]|jgi:serine/threonine-protein kinase|nr:serine/threonine protein kinase [Planctomycetota bacterium]
MTENGSIRSNAAVPSNFADKLLAEQPFPGYRIEKSLASDDRRAVFKAESGLFEQAVALKVMQPWPERHNAAEDFFPLAGSIARLRTSAAARGLDAGRSGRIFFLAYEFTPGENLAERLARRQSGRMSEREALRMVRELARSLQKLFESGQPHGNLKPSNIMLLPEGGEVRLLDIGFAWTLAWPDDADAFAAAPDFLAPERIRGDLNVDVRGDLYSLGAIWYRLLMGEPVFKASTPGETLRMHLDAQPTPPRERDPRLSAATSGLILRLLEKDRDARPRTPRDFLRRLGEHPLFGEGEKTGKAPGPPDT